MTTTTPLNPIPLFKTWFEEAHHCGLIEPDAMTLATASKAGRPSARVVLLRKVDEEGFVFFTNLTSRKSKELIENPFASLCFHWMPLQKQVRVEGSVVQVSDAEADYYFQNRQRGSQIGAWASKQSEKMEHPDDFMNQVKVITEKYEGRPIPRPPFWSGFRVIPHWIEFWQEREFRMHIRDIYRKDGQDWTVGRYYP